MLPKCPKILPDEIVRAAEALAEAYARSPIRPRMTKEIVGYWDSLIEEWANTESLPLFIRKQRADIGDLLIHRESGRLLAPCDNSPAHWVIVTAFEKGVDFTLSDIKNAITSHAIPVTMAMNKSEIAAAKMKGVLARQPSANKNGWKLDHIDDVGLLHRLKIQETPLKDLKAHFLRLMKPSNMVLVPSLLKGLGDMPAFIRIVKTTC